MKKGTVVILGATSAIAKGAAHEFARRGHSLILASRDKKELSRLASDITLRYGVEAEYAFFDALDGRAFFQSLERKTLDGALVAFGTLGKDQDEIIRVNYLGAVSAITALQALFTKQKRGFIIGLSSVAGDRGRQSNYAYGSAKGALSIYLAGLRNKLHPLGIHVMTVKPGFVDTAMTFGLPGLFLVADPQDVGRKIVLALEKKKNVVYIPGFWRWIMLIIKAVPETFFKRLKL